MFVNFSKSHDIYFMHLNTFFCEGVHRFHQTLKGVHGTTKVNSRSRVKTVVANFEAVLFLVTVQIDIGYMYIY